MTTQRSRNILALASGRVFGVDTTNQNAFWVSRGCGCRMSPRQSRNILALASVRVLDGTRRSKKRSGCREGAWVLDVEEDMAERESWAAQGAEPPPPAELRNAGVSHLPARGGSTPCRPKFPARPPSSSFLCFLFWTRRVRRVQCRCDVDSCLPYASSRVFVCVCVCVCARCGATEACSAGASTYTSV